ncbi:hypothetical protein QE152_g13233 [Popillia japonica]|uniref:Uncharacterized protein n=1 Tax=Popillia japonica TaxID=7064 RepID=A0AAW1LEX3_POPJA
MNPFAFNSEGDYAILLDPKEADSNKLLENLSIRFPAVLELAKRNEGQIDFLTSTTATKVRDKEAVERTTTVYVLPLHIGKDGVNDMEESYDMLKDLKRDYRRHPSGKLHLLVSEGLDLRSYILHG